LDPSDLLDHPPQMTCPEFYPIIASDLLARILAKKLPKDLITGWIVEGAVAGGHNAPPRSKTYDERRNPVYDERDIPDLGRIAELGYPFYLAGGYASPERLRQALEAGAAGIQVGSLFSLSSESGYPLDYKRDLISRIHRNEITVRTDGRISPTGFPFKAIEMEGTLGIPENHVQRQRHCDLGYLQQGYVDARGRLLTRCPAEPVEAYVGKGGKVEDTEGRACLCNGLTANIGLAQRQKWGTEGTLFTGGDDLVRLPLGSVETPAYSAEDVIRYLYGEVLQ
jgi:NAD(P)H-dependent flavin oxidoreductase YrpB (nitropropane dioxygenase family)